MKCKIQERKGKKKINPNKEWGCSGHPQSCDSNRWCDLHTVGRPEEAEEWKDVGKYLL